LSAARDPHKAFCEGGTQVCEVCVGSCGIEEYQETESAASSSGRQSVFAAADHLAYVAKGFYPQNDEVARALNAYWNAKRELATQQFADRVGAHMEHDSPKDLLKAALDLLGGDDNTPSAADLDRAAACVQGALEVLPGEPKKRQPGELPKHPHWPGSPDA
jgi:hypothetical protein